MLSLHPEKFLKTDVNSKTFIRIFENGALMLVSLSHAVSLLKNGQLVAIPTETVYGLAADASSDDALTLLYQTKGRPSEHPVILHVADRAMCEPFVEPLSDPAIALMEAFWPGPLTLLLPKTDRVSSRITGGRPLVGVRAPAMPMAQELLQKLGRPVVAPSANTFGHISPTTAAHVEEEFDGKIAVLDGGPCTVGLESTIVKVEHSRLTLMRPGQLSREAIEAAAGLRLEDPETPLTEGVPGALKSHYAPRQNVRLLTSSELQQTETSSDALIVYSARAWPKAHLLLELPSESATYAQQLYSALRQAEASNCREILVEAPPESPEWAAVWDRLRRASSEK